VDLSQQLQRVYEELDLVHVQIVEVRRRLEIVHRLLHSYFLLQRRVLVAQEAEVAHYLELVVFGVNRNLVVIEHVMFVRVEVVVVASGSGAVVVSADFDFEEHFHE
jgi:hypothetical protein